MALVMQVQEDGFQDISELVCCWQLGWFSIMIGSWKFDKITELIVMPIDLTTLYS